MLIKRCLLCFESPYMCLIKLVMYVSTQGCKLRTSIYSYLFNQKTVAKVRGKTMGFIYIFCVISFWSVLFKSRAVYIVWRHKCVSKCHGHASAWWVKLNVSKYDLHCVFWLFLLVSAKSIINVYSDGSFCIVCNLLDKYYTLFCHVVVLFQSFEVGRYLYW
jgi:hypothetical protein